VLGGIHADLQASLTAMLQMCIQEVLGLGVLIKAPKVELDREGNPVTLTYLDEMAASASTSTTTPATRRSTPDRAGKPPGPEHERPGHDVKKADDEDGMLNGRLQAGCRHPRNPAKLWGQRMLEATQAPKT
jgi:hypothetical protein